MYYVHTLNEMALFSVALQNNGVHVHVYIEVMDA